MADRSSLTLPFEHELVVDLFAGGGGASLGISRAYREPDVAVNHDPVAIGVHAANHASTTHFICDVFEVDPVEATGGKPVGLLWASPDCRHHSKAKGGKPRSKRVRGLAWVVVKWASRCKPRLIHLENVEEFADWGPLLKDGSPCKVRKGMTFRRWMRQLENLGYKVEHHEMIAADFGAPTIRKRLYVVARCDGRPIAWPKPTHSKTGAGGLPKWRSAAECIDFSLPSKSIFDRKRPLVKNTCKRIAKGAWRYVLTAAEPFIVGCGGRMGQSPERPVSSPFQTVTSKADACIAAPVLARLRGTQENQLTGHPVTDPVGTVTAGGGHEALVTAQLAPVLIQAAHGEGKPGGVQRWGIGSRDPQAPLGTVTASGGHAVAAVELAPFLTEHANSSTQRMFPVEEPLRTQCAQVKGGHFALAAAHITKFRANSVGSGMDEPLHTITAGGDMKRPAGAAHALGLVTAHLAHLTHHDSTAGNSVEDPLRTVTAAHRGERAVVMAWMEQANTGMVGHAMTEPVSTIVGKGCTQRYATAYFVKFYGNKREGVSPREPMHTVTTKDRIGLVEVIQVPADILAPERRRRAKQIADFLHEHLPEHFPEPADMVLLGDYVMVEITLRMLTPRELARAQGFPDTYVIEFTAAGKPVTKTDQVRLIGNSVCPDMAEAIARVNLADLLRLYAREVAA